MHAISIARATICLAAGDPLCKPYAYAGKGAHHRAGLVGSVLQRLGHFSDADARLRTAVRLLLIV